MKRTMPEGKQWTPAQWEAIVESGKHILVAAAAGSGKTAVLVERIIEKVIDEVAPIDIDQLLVVTFTNASAAEMRERIGEAIEQQLEKNPTSVHLRRQRSLLQKANISTIHSFCLYVIRNFFHTIGIDPNFRIANETEMALLKDEVLDQLLEEYYEAEDEEFFALADTFTNDRSDDQLAAIVLRLYEYALANDEPLKWLDDLVHYYELPNVTTLAQLPYFAVIEDVVRRQLDEALYYADEALRIAELYPEMAPREANSRPEYAQLKAMKEADWETWRESIRSFKLERAKSVKGVDDAVKKAWDDARKKMKAVIEELGEKWFNRDETKLIEDVRTMAPIIRTLVAVIKQFDERLKVVKRQEAIAEFSDLEHDTLAILRAADCQVGEWHPSAVALRLRDQFKEVLVDEYQDTNMVQERLLGLVSNQDEATGNFFMVGDVKQSIYRFRLAEPFLFLRKYERFTSDGTNGLRIDLSKNFRSRAEVLDGTNFLFRQLLDKAVGEVDYTAEAELYLGNEGYPESDAMAIDVTFIERELSDEYDQEIEAPELEARYVAQRIKELINTGFLVYDKKLKAQRTIEYRDIVILMRSMPWAGTISEVFKAEGIPLYAEVNNGYFAAIEVTTILSLLRVIDNPLDDIPLASYLRSPLVGLNEQQLSDIRLASSGYFYDALLHYSVVGEDEPLRRQVERVLKQLDVWRSLANQRSVAELIWAIYRETHYYDFVGGLAGGKQRQANLRALYDRARGYEQTSYRGLARFLRFIARMEDRGDDLSIARALSDAENVVRMMTIHKSKGLEFPVVFVMALGKNMNKRDLAEPVLLDKEYGFAMKTILPEKQLVYPSVFHSAIGEKMKLELLAEELRVLYVALTRAKEKLFLVGSLKDFEKRAQQWERQLHVRNWTLPAFLRATANSYIDWLGTAFVRHRAYQQFRQLEPATDGQVRDDQSQFTFRYVEAETLVPTVAEEEERDQRLQKLERFEPMQIGTEEQSELLRRLEWRYPYETAKRSKQSVTEIKRQQMEHDEYSATTLVKQAAPPVLFRPRFMQQQSMTAAERGTAFHTVMEHIPLTIAPTTASIDALLDDLVARELLTTAEVSVIEPSLIVDFFTSELGQLMLHADRVEREMRFTHRTDEEEFVLIEGIIDCLVVHDGKLTIIDYKTDAVASRFGNFAAAEPTLRERYRIQIELYQKAVSSIWKVPVDAYLYFFDGGGTIHFTEVTAN